MFKKSLLKPWLFLLVSFLAIGLQAQTALNPGDISITGFRSDSDDGFSFVTWVDLTNGTEIRFTDNGWLAASGFVTSENDMSWTNTTGSTILAGTVIVVTCPSGSSSANLGTTSSQLDGLSSSGDQIFAYQGSLATPSLVFGINFDGSTWAADRTSSNNSALPAALASANIAFPEVDNAQFTGARTTNSVAAHQGVIADLANWTANNDGAVVGTLDASPFVIGGGGAPVLSPVTSLATSALGEDEINVSWIKPAGTNGTDWDGVIVFISEHPFSNFWSNNTAEASVYSPNFTFMGGTSASVDGTNNAYCIYNGAANADGNIDIDGLTAGTTYYVAAYSYTVETGSDIFSSESNSNVTTNSPPANSDLIITGIMDGPLPGGNPKVLEIYAMNNVTDMSQYSVQYAGNGSTTYNLVTNFDPISLNAGDFYYISTDSAAFNLFMGFDADVVNTTFPNGLFINGDDHVALFRGATAVDFLGDFGVDGTGTCWDHLDGWAYRNNNSNPTTSFDCAEWTFSGINALDNQLTNATAVIPFPTATYGVIATIDLSITEVMSSSTSPVSSINGDWFEIKNNSALPINLSGFSWDNGSKVAGTHTFGNVTLQPGAVAIVADVTTANGIDWTNSWMQTANLILVIPNDAFGQGFSDLNAAGDVIYIWDDSSNLLDSVAFGAATSGFSMEVSNSVVTAQSAVGVNGAYLSTGGDVGSPSDQAPVIITIPNYTISDINGIDASGVSDSDGVYCSIIGVVTSPDYDGNAGYSFYMSDATGSINVFSFSDIGTFAANVGDAIRVVGTIDQFNGLLEIVADSITVLSSGNSVVALPAAAPSELLESALISIANVSIIDTNQWTNTGSGFNVNVFTAAGDTFVLRVDADINLYGTPVPASPFTLVGIVSQFDNSSPFDAGYQVLPRSTADIIAVPACVLSGVTIGAISKVAAPRSYNVQFTAPAGDLYLLQIRAAGDTTWKSPKSWNNASLTSQNFLAEAFGVDNELRIGVRNAGTWAYSCISTFAADCKPMTVSVIELVAPFCAGDSALLKVIANGGFKSKTFLWSTGETTRFIYGQQGQTYTVVATDESGCTDSASVTVSSLSSAYVPGNFAVVKPTAVSFAGSWTPATLGSGVSLVGYRMQYRQANVGAAWTTTALSTNTSATVDFTGSGNPSANYEFTVFARVNDNGSIYNTELACIERRFYNGSGNKMDNNNSALVAGVKAYPNPTSNILYVEFASNTSGSIEIMDATGRVVYSRNNPETGLLQIDMTEWANGVYILRSQGFGMDTTERIIKN
jgi:hypothetical protein